MLAAGSQWSAETGRPRQHGCVVSRSQGHAEVGAALEKAGQGSGEGSRCPHGPGHLGASEAHRGRRVGFTVLGLSKFCVCSRAQPPRPGKTSATRHQGCELLLLSGQHLPQASGRVRREKTESSTWAACAHQSTEGSAPASPLSLSVLSSTVSSAHGDDNGTCLTDGRKPRHCRHSPAWPNGWPFLPGRMCTRGRMASEAPKEKEETLCPESGHQHALPVSGLGGRPVHCCLSLPLATAPYVCNTRGCNHF